MKTKSDYMIEEAHEWLCADGYGCTKAMKDNFKELFLAYQSSKEEAEKLRFVLIEAAAIGMRRQPETFQREAGE